MPDLLVGLSAMNSATAHSTYSSAVEKGNHQHLGHWHIGTSGYKTVRDETLDIETIRQ